MLEADPTRASAMQGDGAPVVAGEVDSVATYAALHAERAWLVFANLDDPSNTNITLTIREQSQDSEGVELLAIGTDDQRRAFPKVFGEHFSAAFDLSLLAR